MYRPILLISMLVLVLGCKKGSGDKQAQTATPGGPGAGGVETATLPKLQPGTKFKFTGERSSSDRAIQLSDDGKVLAVACLGPAVSRFIKVWALAGEPRLVGEFPGHTFALSPSGKFLATSGDLSPTVYDIATRKPVAKLPLLFSHIFFRGDTGLVWTSRSYDFSKPNKGKVAVWDVTRNADAGSFDVPDDRFQEPFLTNNGKELWLFMSHNKFEVECYDLAGKKLLRTVKPETEAGKPFNTSGIWHSVAPDGSVFTANHQKLNIYDGTTGKNVGVLPPDIWGSETGLLPGGNRYLARASKNLPGLSENDYVIYDWKAKKALAAVVGHSAGQQEPLAAVSGDGKTLVSVSKAGEGLVFDISSAK